MWPTHSGRPALPQAVLFAAAPSEIGHVVSVESDVSGGVTTAGPFSVVFALVSAGVSFFLGMTGLHAMNGMTDDSRLFLSSAVLAVIGGVAGFLAGQRFGVVPAQVRELTYIGLRGAARVRRDRAPEIICFADVVRVQVTDERRESTTVVRTWTFVDHQGALRFVTKGKSTLAAGSVDPAAGTRDLEYSFGNAVSVAAEKALAGAPVA